VRGALSQEGDISLQEHDQGHLVSCKAPEAHDEMRAALSASETAKLRYRTIN
jgi:hypothetical protein